MPPLSLLIKPASSGCNLRCSYCFYRSLASSRAVEDYGRMPYSILEIIVKKALRYADPACTFMFQGGEPTLAGLEFYQKLIEYQNKYNENNIRIHNAIQTNGTLLDACWAEFFAVNRFLVGLSLDGDKLIHDRNRTDIEKHGSFTRVMKAAACLTRAGVEFNTLTVVTKASAKHPVKMYNFFKKNGFHHLQFIPCLSPLHQTQQNASQSPTPEGYLQFLKTLFDLWYLDIQRGEKISIRYFDNLIRMVSGYPPESCGLTGVCTCQFVMEADGSVYPCDFYAGDEWRLGSLSKDSFSDLLSSPRCLKFIEESVKCHEDCLTCKWRKVCGGGCKRDRDCSGKNYYCPCYYAFFEYSLPRIHDLLLNPTCPPRSRPSLHNRDNGSSAKDHREPPRYPVQ